jgi:hypothetical protein
MNTIKIRNLLLLFLVLLALLFVGYKYFEWKTISDLSNLYNTTWVSEFKIVSNTYAPAHDFFSKFTNSEETQVTDPDKIIARTTDLNNSLALYINSEEGYRDLISSNNQKYLTLKPFVSLLFGERGKIAKNIVNDQLNYYHNEIANNKHSLASDYFFAILFGNIIIDYQNLTKYDGKAQISTANFSKNFGDISSLEKYADNSFKFDNEDLIKQEYPTAYQKIQNYKKYFSSYYKVVKDYVNGDTETAAYEYQALKESASDIGIDFNTIFNEGKSISLENSKSTLQLVSDQASNIKQFKTNKLYKYPLLADISTWKEDLVLCQMYDFKMSIYKDISSKYPDAKNVPDLIKQLSTMSPSTDNVDNTFDKSTVLKFVNNDKQIQFVCKDKYTKSSITFTTDKL